MKITRFRSRSSAILAIVTLVAVVAAGVTVAWAADASYVASVEKWRQKREANLRSDDGWLTVSGLFWLHEGDNRFGSSPVNDMELPEGYPAEAGTFEFHAGKTIVHMNPGVAAAMEGKLIQTTELAPDSDPIVMGDISLAVHGSGDRYAIRMRDKNSKLRKDFQGLRWFPVDESYRVVGQWVPYDKPREVVSENILGDVNRSQAAGYVEFTLHGQSLRLEPEQNDEKGMEFVFRDLTAGKETYHAARFLVTGPIKDSKVIMDFNEAYNPPCAFNPYTTCPLPIPENRLKVRVEAGEMSYKH
jgi:uncharacterized protein